MSSNIPVEKTAYEPPPALECRRLGKRIGNRFSLVDVNLTIKRGAVMVLIGPSGAGKTTFLRCLNLLDLIDAGEIDVYGKPVIAVNESQPTNGESLTGGPPKKGGARVLHVIPKMHRRDVGMVFQEFNLWEDRSVLANIIEGPVYAKGITRSDATADAARLAARFAIEDLLARRPGELSGGQRQRVAIVRALAMQPKILLLDEITSALDPELVVDVLNLIRELAQGGLTMVIVTHYLEFARQIAHGVVMMDSGRIIEIGEAEKIFDNPSERRTREFLGKIARAR